MHQVQIMMMSELNNFTQIYILYCIFYKHNFCENEHHFSINGFYDNDKIEKQEHKQETPFADVFLNHSLLMSHLTVDLKKTEAH